MAIEINEIDETEDKKEFIAPDDMWLDNNGDIVFKSNPDIVTFIAFKGQALAERDVVRYGLREYFAAKPASDDPGDSVENNEPVADSEIVETEEIVDEPVAEKPAVKSRKRS